jgi:hypothetical protein
VEFAGDDRSETLDTDSQRFSEPEERVLDDVDIEFREDT